MVEFSELHIDEIIYIIEDNPIIIMELQISDLGYNANYKKRIKVFNKDLLFELDFDDIKEKIYLNKDHANSIALKYIFDKTNKYIRALTDGTFNDYVDLNKSIELYKLIYPEIFI